MNGARVGGKISKLKNSKSDPAAVPLFGASLIRRRVTKEIKFCIIGGSPIFPPDRAASADEIPHSEIFRLAFRGFDYVIRGDWLERALVRSNQFLLLIIRHSHPT